MEDVTRLVLQPWRRQDRGCFYLEDDWIQLRWIHNALRSSKTWGQLEEAMPDEAFESLRHWASAGGEWLYRKESDLLSGTLMTKTSLSETTIRWS